MKILSSDELELIQGGACSETTAKNMAIACGAGIGLIFLTGGLGAIMWGPATAGICAGTILCKDK